MWGVNSSSQIYHYTNDDENPWVGILGTLSDIGAGADGTVWGVDSSSGVFRYAGDAPS
ncbi:hypothetical protein B0I31_102336 [Saccharothrix carnea]|uniref:Uncharacterized protein n=1 Tax=Saccharothrix carnea TaxID=1280637 RepID=A0A2P8IFW1_SACCR|nr:hypothetical protein B0I31_102336 [Saccharothrix carnea]